MKTYTVGIIGFGFIGKVHAYAHLTMPLYYPLDGCGRMLPAYSVFSIMSQKGPPVSRDLIKDFMFNMSLNASGNRPG